jgi:hypothetical protein
MFADVERYDQLKEFCRVNLKAVNPKLVIASGMSSFLTSDNHYLLQKKISCF